MAVKRRLFAELDNFTDAELIDGANVVISYQGDRYGFDTDGFGSVDQIMIEIERAGSAVALEYEGDKR